MIITAFLTSSKIIPDIQDALDYYAYRTKDAVAAYIPRYLAYVKEILNGKIDTKTAKIQVICLNNLPRFITQGVREHGQITLEINNMPVILKNVKIQGRSVGFQIDQIVSGDILISVFRIVAHIKKTALAVLRVNSLFLRNETFFKSDFDYCELNDEFSIGLQVERCEDVLKNGLFMNGFVDFGMIGVNRMGDN
jgi:hypothetical protein